MAQPSPAPADTQRRARPHTPGFSDVFGERLLTFDNGTASSLELLRFKREFSDAPGFEAALRERVDQLLHLRHPNVGMVRGVEWLGAGEGLALVSHHTAGRRLSEVLQDARGPAFAFELIRQLAPALNAIQRHAPGLAHGLLTPDRIVVTREGRLVLVEHALAAAVDTLRWPARRVQADLHLAVPPVEEVLPLDARTDVAQLGFIALSLLLGRRLDPTGYPASLTSLLDEYAREDAATSARLRGWIERALQIGLNSFKNADEANRAFEQLPEAQKPEPAAGPQPVEIHSPAAAPMPAPAPANTVRQAGPATVTPMPLPSPAPDVPAQSSAQKLMDTAARDAAVHQAVIAPTAAPRRAKPNLVRWAVIVLAAVAIAEGIVIGGRWLMAPVVVMGPPSPLADLATPAATPAPVNPAPLGAPAAALATNVPSPAPTATAAAAPTAPPPTAPSTPASTAESTPTPPPAAPGAAAPAPAAPTGRFGGVRINSPIELQVFEAGALVGSTAGPIAVADGRHVFDLVNTNLNFRTRATVDVKAGQMASVPVSLPNGRININAAPWAEVSINGNPAGQTPLANMAIPIGTHEIVFRHPQFGEQRHTVVVKADEPTRVSANFRP